MKTVRLPILPLVASALVASAVLPAQAAEDAPPAGELFENVVRTLKRRYWNKTFRREKLPGIAAKYRAAAKAAESLAEECVVVDGFLSNIPSSHLALYTAKTQRGMMAELMSRKTRMLGMQVKQKASHYFACKIFEGGPADRAGIKRGDRVVSIDGKAPQFSPRLGRRTDDAYLDDAPLHAVHVDAEKDEEVRFVIERKPGQRREVMVTSTRFRALAAAQNSVRVIEAGGKRIGYVHFWYIHAGCVKLLRDLIEDEFAECDALIFDLRGRGGNGMEAAQLARFFTPKRKRWPKPFAALMDKESRSAKEMLAYEFKTKKVGTIIGERSAGALVPASFQDVGQGMVLMFPSFRLGRYSDKVELIGVEPDIQVDYPLPYTAGKDPILERAIAHFAQPGRK